MQTSIDAVPGFKVAAVGCGIRKSGRLDLALITSETDCAAAGVFTTNQVKAAPVLVDQAHLARNASGIHAVVINSGIANACTGDQGMEDAVATTVHVAQALGCSQRDVLVMSTGVIGMTLPMSKLQQGILDATAALQPDAWADVAQAIMTTDTRPKSAAVQVTTPEGSYTIAGVSKGSGMIAPNMATMLGVITTDALIDAPALQEALWTANGLTFNQIVVDGDMSTNDSVVVLANGVSGVEIAGDDAVSTFTDALTMVCEKLAKDIVRDGEGASRFITIEITSAADDESARQVGMTIATSPLVKTAFFGGDANWGRILAAAGRAGVALKADALALWFAPGEDGAADGLQIVANGGPTSYEEEDAAAIMAHDSVSMRLDLGMGDASATIWTCDLSHEYVTINGHYRT